MKDTKLIELRDNFFESVSLINDIDEIISAIPSYSSFSGYDELLKGIIDKSNNMILEYKEMLNTDDSDLIELLKDEIIKFNYIIEICTNLLNSKEEVETKQCENERQIIFATSKNGNSLFERDLKDIIIADYQKVLKCFEIAKNYDKITNKEKLTRYTSINKRLSGLAKAKDYQTRVFFKPINKEYVYVFGVDTKKDDNSKRDREVVEQRFYNVIDDYEMVKKLLSSEKTKDQVLVKNNTVETVINEILKGGLKDERKK